MLTVLGRWRLAAGMIAGSLAAFGAVPPHPGVLNYIEGQATVNGRALSARSVGSVDVEPGQTIDTGNGRAEMLLTPGVFLRLGDNSSLRMVSPDLLNTQVDLTRGSALVEVTELHDGNNLRVNEDGAQVSLLKHGLYRFDADRQTVAVYDGKAMVNRDDQQVEVKSGRQVNLNGPLQAQKFDKKDAEQQDPLYAWSKLRSQYLSEASAQMSRTYVINGAGWYGPGWYWDPWFSSYSFLPGAGFLNSPFGWGFYSPLYWGGGWGPGYYRHVPLGRRFVGPSSRIVAPRVHPGPRGGFGGGSRSFGGVGGHRR